MIFFETNGLAHEEFILAAIQSIPHTTVTIYGDCVKMCKDFAANFGYE
jgi:hypothetical protein